MSEADFSLFRQGLFIGLAIAAPVGPISILCIQRSIKKGFVSGFASGLGASTGDAIYAFVGAFGLNLIAASLMNPKIWFSLVGGVFLCYLGIKTFLEKPAVCMDKINSSTQVLVKKNHLLKDYFTTLILNQINPITVLMFAAVFAQSGSTDVQSDSIAGGLFVLGVFISTVLWRVCLSGIANRLSGGLKPRQLQGINRVSDTTISIWLRFYWLNLELGILAFLTNGILNALIVVHCLFT
jgi:threonine/homoserine/homoserine lactone efflux protein